VLVDLKQVLPATPAWLRSAIGQRPKPVPAGKLSIGIMRNVLVTAAGILLVQIADMLGYADQSAFHQAFRRWTGTTPRKFRLGAFAC